MKKNYVKLGILFVICVCSGIALSLYQKPKTVHKKTSVFPIYVNLDEIVSPFVLLEEMESERVIVEKNSEDLIYPASMTKMMTALVAIEQLTDLDEIIEIPNEIFPYLWEENASVAGFEAHEKVSVRDLLYGVLLPSGADCTLTLAYHVASSEEAFADMMNQKAEKLGMSQTHFVNSSGLHDERQTTTPKDLVKLMRYALSNETFKNIFTAEAYTSSPTKVHPKGIQMHSTMFSSLPNKVVPEGEILGGKTGFTGEAGRCLASYANIDGVDYLLVTAKADGSPSVHAQDAYTIYIQLADNRLYQWENVRSELFLNFQRTDKISDFLDRHVNL